VAFCEAEFPSVAPQLDRRRFLQLMGASLAFGGLAAILEPVCNVLLLPIHDRFWDKHELRINSGMHAA